MPILKDIQTEVQETKYSKFSGELWLNPIVGDLYSRVERITGPFATPLLEQAGLGKITQSVSVLDLCCGTGVVSAHLQEIMKKENATDKVHLTCGDLSDGQLAHISKRIDECKWKNAKAVKVNCMNTGLPSGSFDHVIIAMALMLIPDPVTAVDECMRMLKPGGTFSISTWLYEAWNEDVRQAISTLPGSPPWPETSDELILSWSMGAWNKPSFVKSSLEARGFTDVKVEVLSVHMPMHNAEDFASIYEAFIEFVTDKYWTEAQRQKYRPMIKEVVLRTANAKYGEGKPFTTERVNIMVTAKKPLNG